MGTHRIFAVHVPLGAISNTVNPTGAPWQDIDDAYIHA